MACVPHAVGLVALTVGLCVFVVMMWSCGGGVQRASPREVALTAIEDAKYMCTRQHGDAPDVTLHGRLDLTFSYVTEHVHYILLELLKNSMR